MRKRCNKKGRAQCIRSRIDLGSPNCMVLKRMPCGLTPAPTGVSFGSSASSSFFSPPLTSLVSTPCFLSNPWPRLTPLTLGSLLLTPHPKIGFHVLHSKFHHFTSDLGVVSRETKVKSTH